MLRKPDRLNDSEWAAVHRAPRLSARLLQRFTFAAQQAKAVEFQHERYDGAGYYGVDGRELPLASHFLIVADSFDAMTTERAFRARLPREEALEEIERNAGSQFHPAIAKAFVAVQRGQDPASVLTKDELTELRDAAVPHRLPHVRGARDLHVRPELLALFGLALALVGGGLERVEVLAAGAALTGLGILLYGLRRFRAARLAAALRSLCVDGQERIDVFDRLYARLEGACGISWAGLVTWPEHGLGGALETERGEKPPAESSLQSWFVREAQAAEGPVAAPGFELGCSGVVVALPLRRENSALAGFVVFAANRPLPDHVAQALGEVLDRLGVVLAPGPHAEPERSTSLAAAS